MPKFSVQNKKGEWACFSTTVNDFICDFMPLKKYEKWRIKMFGLYYKDLHLQQMDYEEAMQISLCNNDKIDKGFDLDDIPDNTYECDYCKFWDKEKNCCTIVEQLDK